MKRTRGVKEIKKKRERSVVHLEVDSNSETCM